MYIDMSCSCGASFITETDNDNLSLLWANRFINAHNGCGFMSPQFAEGEETTAKRFNIAQNKPIDDL